MTRPFDKPALTYSQQVDLLRQRGMHVEDSEKAAFYLQHLNYYRLCAYWLPFESDHASHRFRPGTRFSDVLGLYVFDRELRLLVLDAVERINDVGHALELVRQLTTNASAPRHRIGLRVG